MPLLPFCSGDAEFARAEGTGIWPGGWLAGGGFRPFWGGDLWPCLSPMSYGRSQGSRCDTAGLTAAGEGVVELRLTPNANGMYVAFKFAIWLEIKEARWCSLWGV